MAIKAWDAYVAEATKPAVTIPLPDGEYTVEFPCGEKLQEFNVCRFQGKEEDALKALFGARLGGKLITLAKKAPAGTLGGLINDVLVEWGMATAPNSGTSSS